MNQAVRLGRVVAGGFCLCGILLAAGCGGGKGVVSGKVLYQGKPVRGGTVSFVPEGGGVMSSPIEEDGSYTIRNIPPGTVKITVETTSFRPFSMLQGTPGSGPPPEFMKKMQEMNVKMPEKTPELADPQRANELADPQRAKRYVPIPPQYGDPDKSNLTYTVKSGKQEHHIDLK